ncbi:MAG: hypothetical protein EXR50_08575, partial [Dehalococcoidia bacterium]|nr:hypothetical protein [Dehalococcoidia bacterium]
MSISKLAAKAKALTGQPQYLYVAIPAFYAITVSLFLMTRYGGRLAENDTSIFNRFISNVTSSGALVSATDAYTQGMGFQAVASFVISVTGVSVDAFLSFVYLLLSPSLAVMAYTLFRAFTGSARLASLSAFFLFIQPEFLFILFRGNHEKVTFSLVLTALLLLVIAPLIGNRLHIYATFMGLFYLMSFALVTVNVGFAMSWVFAVAASCALGYLISIVFRQFSMGAEMARLFYISTSSMIFIFLFIFYMYTPSIHFIQALTNAVERGAVLLLAAEPAGPADLEGPAMNPYEYVNSAWTSPATYVLLTSFNWMVAVLSFVMWLYMGYKEIIGRTGTWDRPRFTLWLFYAAFGAQVVAGVITDRSGQLGANLQLRVFPLFMLFALPLAAMALERGLINTIEIRALRLPVTGLALALVVWFSVAGLLKATNDPYFSNRWTFYLPQEREGITWASSYLQYSKMWVDFDERTRTSGGQYSSRFQATNQFDPGVMDPDTRYVMISDIVMERSKRVKGITIPNV